jgi:serine/threonine protein kinase
MFSAESASVVSAFDYGRTPSPEDIHPRPKEEDDGRSSASMHSSLPDDTGFSADRVIDYRTRMMTALNTPSHPVRYSRSTEELNCLFSTDRLPVVRDIPQNVLLDDIQNIEFMAEGSCSHTYSATWKGTSVVLKMIQVDKMRDQVALQEFKIERDLLMRLDHPGIVKILGCGTIPRPFIILERLIDFAKTLDLHHHNRPSMFRRRPYAYMESLRMAKDIADALTYIHTQVHADATIIHRDLKPDNLGLTVDGRVKIFDFGVCTCVKRRTKSNQTYEMTGNTGSLRYMAPEVVKSQPYNESVDVYSFALVVWAIAKNDLPFRDFHKIDMQQRVAQMGERPVFDTKWPAGFTDLLRACWHEDLTMRPDCASISYRLVQLMGPTKPRTFSIGGGTRSRPRSNSEASGSAIGSDGSHVPSQPQENHQNHPNSRGSLGTMLRRMTLSPWSGK